MFIGAQISLYPLCDRFAEVILDAVAVLDPYRDRLRIETDDISTLLVGPPESLFPAMQDLFVAPAKTGVHTILQATVSRGCPGEPDDPVCRSPVLDHQAIPDAEQAIAEAMQRLPEAPVEAGVRAVAQVALYPLGTPDHMADIAACIGFLRRSGAYDRPKNFCTKLCADAGQLFPVMAQAFLGFGAGTGHAVLTATVSANSPSANSFSATGPAAAG